MPPSPRSVSPIFRGRLEFPPPCLFWKEHATEAGDSPELGVSERQGGYVDHLTLIKVRWMF